MPHPAALARSALTDEGIHRSSPSAFRAAVMRLRSLSEAFWTPGSFLRVAVLGGVLDLPRGIHSPANSGASTPKVAIARPKSSSERPSTHGTPRASFGVPASHVPTMTTSPLNNQTIAAPRGQHIDRDGAHVSRHGAGAHGSRHGAGALIEPSDGSRSG